MFLCRGKGIIEPEQLGIAVGSPVRVRGTMVSTSAIKFFKLKGTSGGLAKGVSAAETWQPDSELVIQVKGNPKALN